MCVWYGEYIFDHMDVIFCALAYPTLFIVCSAVCAIFCNDHQLVGVSRCEEHPWATGRWWFRRI